MLYSVLLAMVLVFASSHATCTDNLAQKKATLEAKAATEKEEVLRWNELSESAQRKFAVAKRQLMSLKADLQISQDEMLAASNRVHCSQNKLAELDQLACQLKNKIDEEYQRKITLERNINLRAAKKRKRNARQAVYNGQGENGSRNLEILDNGSNLGPDLDLSKLSDIALLRKSLDPVYRQTIDNLARQSLEAASKKEVAAKPRHDSNVIVHDLEAFDEKPRVNAPTRQAKPRCDQKEQDEMAALKKVKMDIFQDEALLRNAVDQLESAQTLLTAEQNRMDEISRRICSVRYDLKESEQSARERLDALQQAQSQAAAHQDILTNVTKQLQAVVAEMTHREMSELASHFGNAEQHAAKRSTS